MVKNNSSTNTIEVNKDKLDQIIANNEELNKKIEILQKTTSEVRYKEAEEEINKEGKKLIGHCKVLEGVVDGSDRSEAKLIVGWHNMVKIGSSKGLYVYDRKGKKMELKEEDSKAKSEILYQNGVAVGEKLIGHYITIDGESIVTDAVNFYRSTAMEKFDILDSSDDYYKVRFHNHRLPQDYKINIRFINA